MPKLHGYCDLIIPVKERLAVIDERTSNLPRAYASKWVEKISGGFIIAVLMAVLGAILKLVIK